ncbi:MAG: glutathione S-transferase family protein [Alphaproteobacteria bacterium]|nr:glutathione S-transferase family protein [Alphaproteobacteria bacterium]
MSDVKLYGFQRSNYFRTARLTLEEKGVAYDIETVALGSDEVRAVHPFGKVPSLAHGDFVIYETSAICRYVDEAFDGPPLQPGDIKGRALVEQWISSLNRNYDTDMIRHVVRERLYAPLRGLEPDEAKIADALPRLEREMEVLDSQLGQSAYICGGDVTLADLFLVPMMSGFQQTPEGQNALEGRDNIAEWWERMAARPSFAANTVE